MKKSIYLLVALCTIFGIIMTSSCKSNKEIVQTQNQQFLITLVKDVNVEKVLSNFKKFNISDIKNVSRSENMHTFKASMSDDLVNQFMAKVKENPKVVSLSKALFQQEKPTNSTSVKRAKTKPIKQ